MCDYNTVMKKTIELFRKGADVGSIGKSYKGRIIPYIHVGGYTGNRIIVIAAIHAREHVTSWIALCQACEILKNCSGEDGFYFLPCVNPDGVEIAFGTDEAPLWYDGDPGLYKANARGVDLNVNFNAGWGTGKSNRFSVSGENYVGEYPLSEPESKALAKFTSEVMPSATVGYHSKGREIYYEYKLPERLKKRYRVIAEKLSAVTGYKIVENLPSAGGYKDWCQEKLRIPAFTIEIGDDSLAHPLSEKQVKEDCKRNLFVPQIIAECLKRKTKNS